MGCRPLQILLGLAHGVQALVPVSQKAGDAKSPLRGERTAAAAASRGVGILKDESLAHQGLFVFEDSAGKIEQAFGIDEDAGAEFLENLVAITGLRVETHGVGEAGATAALDTDAQAALIERHTVFFEQGADFLRGALGDADGWGAWRNGF